MCSASILLLLLNKNIIAAVKKILKPIMLMITALLSFMFDFWLNYLNLLHRKSPAAVSFLLTQC